MKAKQGQASGVHVPFHRVPPPPPPSLGGRGGMSGVKGYNSIDHGTLIDTGRLVGV